MMYLKPIRICQTPLVKMKFQVEDERDALAVAEDIALMEGGELIYLYASPQP